MLRSSEPLNGCRISSPGRTRRPTPKHTSVLSNAVVFHYVAFGEYGVSRGTGHADGHDDIPRASGGHVGRSPYAPAIPNTTPVNFRWSIGPEKCRQPHRRKRQHAWIAPPRGRRVCKCERKEKEMPRRTSAPTQTGQSGRVDQSENDVPDKLPARSDRQTLADTSRWRA